MTPHEHVLALLAETSTAPPRDMRQHWQRILDSLGDAIGADTGYGAIQVLEPFTTEPCAPLDVVVHRPDRFREDVARGWADGTYDAKSDAVSIALRATVGGHRVTRIGDVVPRDEFLASDTYRSMRAADATDRIAAFHAVSNTAEVMFVYDKQGGEFDAAAVELLDLVVRSLTMVFRWLALSYGVLPRAAVLTPAQREVLHRLLTGESEKEIAAATGRTYGSLHQIAVRVYRKLGVSSRAELMSLWLDPTAIELAPTGTA
ncbi:MAG: helix-turn-helix transcriptional regulator [Myxococcota bacterium]|nr:helix-turn-helix transcriptional regulator [Myxococcota bacterium]